MAEEMKVKVDLKALKEEVYETPNFPLSFLKAAKILGLNVISSQPFMSGIILSHTLSRDTFKCHHNSARHLNFISSIPSKALKSTLVGMKTPHHLEQNLEVIYREKLTQEDFFQYVKSLQDPTKGAENSN